MKSSYGGWQNWHTENIYPYVCSCYGEGADDRYTNNTCIVRDGGGCPFWPAYASDAPTRHGAAPANFLVGHNRVYASDNRPIRVGYTGNMTLQEWQALGHDVGTTLNPLPQDRTLRAQIRALLHKTL